MAKSFFFLCGGLFFLVASAALGIVVLDRGHLVAGVVLDNERMRIVVVTHNGETYVMHASEPYAGVGNIHAGDIKGLSK